MGLSALARGKPPGITVVGVATTGTLDRLDEATRATVAASAVALAPYDILNSEPEPEYDDLAQLAADLCGTPIGLVTLFDADRQWFKARRGLDVRDADHAVSLCTFVLDEPDVLILPDLTRDPRTADNPQVTADGGLRFYAGAPLRLADGTTIGSLCVVDIVARPAGLTDAQTAGLRALSRQVIALLEFRRLLRVQAAGHAQWRALFYEANEGFIVGEIVRGPNGAATDWRYLDVNPAWGEQLGMPSDEVAGRTIREIFPEVEESWITDFAEVARTGTPLTFRRQVGMLGRWFEGRVFRIGPDRFACLFLNVSEQVEQEQRQAALLAIGDRLRDLDTVEAMSAAAVELLGTTLRAIRVGYGRLDPTQTLLDVGVDWVAPGFASVAGLHRWADYGNLLDELLVGDALIIEDVRTDPRTASDPQPMMALGIIADVHMPVMERGRTTSVFFVHDDRPRRWSDEDLAFLRDVADRLETAIARLELERRRVVQTQEMSHRVKNTLAMVQAIASQTLKPVTERDAVGNFERRLTALSAAHDVLLGREWQAAPFAEVIQTVLASAGQDERVQCDGPPVLLSPRAVLSASLLFHELATNAAKYGALSVPTGTVLVDWSVRSQDGRPTLFLAWTERGGPAATVPTRRGFGSRLINMGLVGTGGVELSYGSLGFAARMSVPVDDLTNS